MDCFLLFCVVLLCLVVLIRRARTILAVEALNRGFSALDNDEYDKALTEFTEVIRLNLNNASGYKGRGLSYLWSKDYTSAITDFTETIRLDSRDTSAYQHRGFAYLWSKDYDSAIPDLTEAIQLDPTIATTYEARGSAYLCLKEYDSAIPDFTEVIRLDPNCVRGYNILAWVLATCSNDDLRDGKRAIELATKACQLSDWKEPNSLENLAAAYAECQDFEHAIKWQRNAIELGATGVPDKENADQLLRLYEEGKPYRDK